MDKAPVLLLQMHRMGDLILCFPLLGWLAKLYPNRPLWVVGEERFFTPLMPFSPQATYFSYEAAPALRQQTFHLVINASHSPQAAALAGSLRCEQLIGPYLNHEGSLHIQGDWQLYRASLTHNNRYNLYHWADLNALDCIPEQQRVRTSWTGLRSFSGVAPARIGLFLGASEPSKHPDATFWAELTRQLLSAGHKPVLLGGTTEIPLGHEVANALHAPAMNLCGQFPLNVFATFMAELDLLITPDTGPMHLAAWTGTPTLNLSLGPVNPWETGPFGPGQYILQANIACAGCWECSHTQTLCRQIMQPHRVRAAAQAILAGEFTPDLAWAARGLVLFHTQRDKHGLHSLNPVFSPLDPGAASYSQSDLLAPCSHQIYPEWAGYGSRLGLSRFWQAWFGQSTGLFSQEESAQAWSGLVANQPKLSPAFRQGLARLSSSLSKCRGSKAALLDDSFWLGQSPLLRPLSGYIQMYARNEKASRASLLHALALVENLSCVCDRAK